MATTRKIAPPAPRVEPDRTVYVPPTIGQYDTNEVPPPDKSRIDFRPEHFVRVLNQHGKYVTWRKAVICPCFNETTGQADVSCGECDGSGFFYIDPINIRAHMAMSDKNTSIYERFGMWMDGATQATVEAKYRLGFRDSLEMRDSVMNFNELLKKGNRRGTRSKLPTGKDSARYRIVNMVRMLFQDTAKNMVYLEDGYHFKIDDNGWIEWLTPSDALVPDGTWLTALYDFHPVYLVMSNPHATRDDVSGFKTDTNKVISLPIQAAMKLDFLVDVNVAAPVTGVG